MFIYWPNNYYLETICSYTNRELYKHKQIISGKYVWAYIVRLLHIYCNTHRPEFISQRSSFYPFFFFPLLFLLLCTYVYTLLLLLYVCVCVTTTKKCNFSRRFGRKEREREKRASYFSHKKTHASHKSSKMFLAGYFIGASDRWSPIPAGGKLNQPS